MLRPHATPCGVQNGNSLHALIRNSLLGEVSTHGVSGRETLQRQCSENSDDVADDDVDDVANDDVDDDVDDDIDDDVDDDVDDVTRRRDPTTMLTKP